MSLKYISRFQFNDDLAEEDFGNDLAVETPNTIQSQIDVEYGKVLLLDGATSLLSSGDFALISGALDRSFSFWAKNDNVLPLENPVLSYGDLGDEAFIIYSGNSANNPEINDLTTNYVALGHTNVSAEWYHYTVTFASTGALLIYVDSILVDSFSIPTLSTGTGDGLRIGTDGMGQYFTGNLSDLRIYDTVLDPTTIEYIFSVGPNFEEKVDVNFVEKIEDFGLAVSSVNMSRSEYSIHESGETLKNSFYITDDNSDLQEASRVEYTNTNISIKTRHTETTTGDDVLYSSIDLNAESATFTNIDDTDTSSSIVFSSEGVSITSGDPGLYFGASKDFRMSVDSDFFIIQAYNNSTGEYNTKMEVGK